MKIILLLFGFELIANAQSGPRNIITFSGGYARDMNPSYRQTDTAVSLGATYGYRFRRYFEAEAGITAALQPAPEIRGAFYDIKPDDRFIWVPFGLRGVLSSRNGWVELSAGGGGLYEKYSVSNPSAAVGLLSRDGWGGYFVAGAAVALDRNRHFWIGTSPHLFLANANHGYAHDRWFVVGGELSFRF